MVLIASSCVGYLTPRCAAGQLCCYISECVLIPHRAYLCRVQAPIGGLLAAVLPRAQIVPAVPLENISNDPEVVSALRPQASVSRFQLQL